MSTSYVGLHLKRVRLLTFQTAMPFAALSSYGCHCRLRRREQAFGGRLRRGRSYIYLRALHVDCVGLYWLNLTGKDVLYRTVALITIDTNRPVIRYKTL